MNSLKNEKIMSESKKINEIKNELINLTKEDEDIQMYLNNNEYQENIKSIFYFLYKFELIAIK